MPFLPTNLSASASTDDQTFKNALPSRGWMPILEHHCDFDANVFENVSLNLIKNPNINSTHLFRADILYDSSKQHGEATSTYSPDEVQSLLHVYAIGRDEIPGFELDRTLVRLMIPRNPQLDKPIAQTCQFFSSTATSEPRRHLVVYVPHASSAEALPWYHPSVKSLIYLHSWEPDLVASPSDAQRHSGSISLHFKLFDSQQFPLPPKLLRTAHHLLSTLYRHGQGALRGYTKHAHHDQLISQQRVQDRYTELKGKFARKLCDHWVEQTEPSKHVFEDLGIAAFLIELWTDMYRHPKSKEPASSATGSSQLPPFPGFVDIGCGNGVLTEILLLSGYSGWGFDARRRKTWSTLSPITQKNLHQLFLMPQPLFDFHRPKLERKSSSSTVISKLLSMNRNAASKPSKTHNGIFERGTFIISNHADELTPWTPLLASVSRSPFLAIPCCSHNLSGLRFRAPSAFNSNSAGHAAPTFFAKDVGKLSKSVAISILPDPDDESEEAFAHEQDPGDDADCADGKVARSRPETGDLKKLSPHARSKQPSAYSSLCEWVSHLSQEVGYETEREMLRIPSTRNIGIVGRVWADGEGEIDIEKRRERVAQIVRREGADGRIWAEPYSNPAKKKKKVGTH
ncbi:tRNA(Ser) Um(44) 2'-O-methyltransferase [Bachmanniomyces sp. S44760]|nr:tRNA(Ser) Um(44) 2'-O-methyltransferase [Bachmanniomyces sp. S44760]